MNSARNRSPWLKWIRITGTVLSIGMLVWLIAQQDWPAFLKTLSSMRWEYVLAAAALVILTQVLNASRWFSLLRAIRLPITWVRSTQLFFAGLYVSNFLPTTIGGDVLRLAGIAAEAEERLKAGATVIIDRLVSLTGMAFLLPFSIIHVIPALGASAWSHAPLVFLGFNGFTRIRSSLERVWGALLLWRTKPGALLTALAVSLAGVFSYLVSLLLLARELGIEVNLAQVAGVTGLTYFITLLPISLNGWGVREVGVVAFYSTLGAETDQAVALALVSRALLMISSLPGALWVGDVLARISSQTLGESKAGEDN